MKRARAYSQPTLAVLSAFASQPQAWRHGYDLLKETGLHSGTVYPLLMRLFDQGLLESEWRTAQREGKPPRHAYRLTKAGLAVANAQDFRSAAGTASTGLATT